MILFYHLYLNGLGRTGHWDGKLLWITQCKLTHVFSFITCVHIHEYTAHSVFHRVVLCHGGLLCHVVMCCVMGGCCVMLCCVASWVAVVSCCVVLLCSFMMRCVVMFRHWDKWPVESRCSFSSAPPSWVDTDVKAAQTTWESNLIGSNWAVTVIEWWFNQHNCRVIESTSA